MGKWDADLERHLLDRSYACSSARSEQYEFRDWRVAFEVDLKMCSQSELEGATSTTYTSSQQYERHGHMADRELRHIYLDFQRESLACRV